MKRGPFFLLPGLAVLAWLSHPQVHAQDKVHTVGKDGLKIQTAVDDTNPKIKFKPAANVDFELPGKSFMVKLAGGTRYKIDLVSADRKVDPVLIVFDSAGNQLGFDDDGGEGLNSLLLFPAPKDGDYKICACRLNGSGDLTLSISAAGKAEPIKTIDIGPKGGEVKGKITDDNKFVRYEVKLAEGKTYVIDLIADDKGLDPLLKLIDPAGRVLAVDDDGGGGLNSRITHRATAAGTYQIEATRLIGEGSFTLRIREQ